MFDMTYGIFVSVLGADNSSPVNNYHSTCWIYPYRFVGSKTPAKVDRCWSSGRDSAAKLLRELICVYRRCILKIQSAVTGGGRHR